MAVTLNVSVLPVLVSFCLLGQAAFPAYGTSQEKPADRLLRVQKRFKNQIRPILKKSCGDCHWGDNDDAGVNLEPFETIDQLLDARKLWRKVLTRVAAREMPPADSEPLTDKQHQQVTTWIDDLLNSVDCSNIHAGRVTIRRLNRTEYRNTIRDLFGYDYRPSRNFPGDDVGYGFDNIADVLSLPPRLMEKYLDAAEHIASRTIVDPDRGQYRKKIAGSEFRASDASQPFKEFHAIYSNGSISHSINAPVKGRYRVEVMLRASEAGDEQAKLGVGLQGSSPKVLTVPASGDRMTAVSTDLQLEKGRQRLQLSFLNDYFVPATENRPAIDRNLFIATVSLHGPLDANGDFSKRWLAEIAPANQLTVKDARNVLESFVTRAWRRPATESDMQRIMQLYRTSTHGSANFYDGIRTCVQAVLVSPHFLFKIETPHAGEADSDGARLNDFQLATRLSYFLWSTMPDDKLFELAADNTLHRRDVLIAQVKRMLKDPKADALVDNFVAQWLQLPKLAKVRPDPDLFPGVDQALRRDMAIETKLLVNDLIKRDASIIDLLDADYTFLNRRLASHYGVEGVSGDSFRKISLKESGRSGIISHASILTLTSNPTRTSPVKRGKWIMENLLGEEPPPPDPDAIPLENQEQLTGTTRQRMIQHREDPNCAVCHKVMDELGFALENFDAVGRWRDQDEGLPVDSRGELPDGTTFDGADAMQAVIATNMKHKFVQCLTEKMLIYALGRGLEYFDECTTDAIMVPLAENDYRFSELITQIVLSKPFQERSAARGHSFRSPAQSESAGRNVIRDDRNASEQ